MAGYIIWHFDVNRFGLPTGGKFQHNRKACVPWEIIHNSFYITATPLRSESSSGDTENVQDICEHEVVREMDQG
jgi:hypothetical protein